MAYRKYPINLFKSSLNLILLFALSCQGLYSQNSIDFDVLSSDDGLSSSFANTIIQDSKGFIWIGTWNGLNRYDGQNITVYQPKNRDTTTLCNREVCALLEDHEGYIWIGTSNGLNRLNPRTDKMDLFPFEKRILSLCEDSHHKIWIGLMNDGLYKLDPVTGKRNHYLSKETVGKILEDSQHNFWIATDQGLINFDRETAHYSRYLYLPALKRNTQGSYITVNDIAESPEGQLWIGTLNEGLYKVLLHQNNDSLRFIKYYNRHEKGSLNSDNSQRLCFDNDGNLWIGTYGGGLNLLEKEEQNKSPENARFSVFINDIDNPYSLSGNNIISALMVDRSGMLWVGSKNINRTKVENNRIIRYNTRYHREGNVYQNTVRTISNSGKNFLWVGTTDELRLYKYQNNRYEETRSIKNLSYKYNGKDYTSLSILSMLNDPQGKLWVGTDGSGLLLFDQQKIIHTNSTDYQFFNTETPSGKLPSNRVSYLCASKKYPGVIWVGTLHSGFSKCIFHNGSYSFENFKSGSGQNTLTDNNIRVILEDSQGIVWIGTQHGLNRFDPETGKFTPFYFNPDNFNSINDNIINVLYEDDNNNLWIGTCQGLNKKTEYKTTDGKRQINFLSYPNLSLLNNEIILSILEDTKGYLWIGTYKKIIRFDTHNDSIKNIFSFEEYQRIRSEMNSVCMDKRNLFCWGGANGFITFYPDSLIKRDHAPNVQITDLLIYNKKVPVGEKSKDGRIILRQSITYTDSLTLNHKDGVFTFVFSAMDYKSPGKNQYAYFLEGYDNSWNQIGNRNTATYTGIPPGKYIFKVKASNSQGVWSNQPHILFLNLIPPWWRTSWAYMFYVTILLGLLYFFKKYTIIRNKEKSQLMLEHVRYEKDHELNELKVHFFTNITHELRTPLTLILGPLEEMLMQKEKLGPFSRSIELVERNAHRLLRLINQLIEFRKLEKNKMELFPQKTNIIPFLTELYESFKNMADSKNIHFTLQYNEPSMITYIDRDKFDKIMFNLLSNAFKFTEKGGDIQIRAGFNQDDEIKRSFFVEVEDTGIGIPSDKKEAIFERFYQINQKGPQNTGGIGLYLSKAFVDLHQGTINIESEPGKGSCFRIALPVDVREINGDQVILADQDNNTIENIYEKINPVTDLEYISQNDFEIHDNDVSDLMEINNEKMPLVLLVEDDMEMAEFIAKGISSYFTVKSVDSGARALEYARKFSPDIIVSDILMPGMDGLELCKRLQNDITTSHIPVVFLTAKTASQDEIEGLQMGAVDYIYKPFSMTSLRLKLKNILTNRADLQKKFKKNLLLEPEKITLTSLDEKFLKNAFDAVNKNIDDPLLDVEKLSSIIGLSPNQTYRKLKALTGQTAKEFIRVQRLKTSAHLLLQKKRSISEIMYMVGFSSPSYFTRCFREYFGWTPSEYIEHEGKHVPD